MNIYAHENGVLLTGKAWEVRQKLKEYGKYYEYVSDWVGAQPANTLNVSYHKPALIMNTRDTKPAVKVKLPSVGESPSPTDD